VQGLGVPYSRVQPKLEARVHVVQGPESEGWLGAIRREVWPGEPNSFQGRVAVPSFSKPTEPASSLPWE